MNEQMHISWAVIGFWSTRVALEKCRDVKFIEIFEFVHINLILYDLLCILVFIMSKKEF